MGGELLASINKQYVEGVPLINVLLVDDHELVRTGIRRILDDVRGFKVVGEAKTGEEAVTFCRQNEPDIVLMDMNMPGIGGLEATKRSAAIALMSKSSC